MDTKIYPSKLVQHMDYKLKIDSLEFIFFKFSSWVTYRSQDFHKLQIKKGFNSGNIHFQLCDNEFHNYI